MKKRFFTILLATLFLVTAVFSVSACNGVNSWLSIDVPEGEQEGYIGTYEIPVPVVRNADGEIMLGYDVYIKNVKNPDGKKMPVESGGTIEANQLGVYTITYGAKGIKEAKMKVRFVHAPPTVTIAQGALPDTYVSGQWYDIPLFRLGGGAVYGAGKTTVKLYHQPDGGERTEIPLTSGFMATYGDGKYVWAIHAVNNKDVSKDFEFTVRAEKGPSLVIPGKVTYFDQEIGNAQIGLRGGIVAEYDGNRGYGNEQGSIRAVFPGPGGTKTFMYMKIVRPWEADITDYDYLVMRLYNANAYDIYYFWDWFAYTKCPAGEWTEIVWDLRKEYSDQRTGLPFSACMGSRLEDGLDITSIDMHFFVPTPSVEPTSPFGNYTHNDPNIPFKNGINGQVLPKNAIVNLSAVYAVKFRGPKELTTEESHTAATGYRGGPLSQGMTLGAGYAAVSTGEYTIGDFYTVQKAGGPEQITWNAATRKMDIAPGLTAGSHTAEFDILDAEGHSALKYRFTVTVA